MSGMDTGERRDCAQMSSDDKPVPCLQRVMVDDERVGLVVDRPIQISQPKLGD